MDQPPLDEKIIAILGAGAVGQLIYQQLLADGNAPLLIVREQLPQPEQPQTITFTALEGKVTESTAILTSPKSPSPRLKQIQLVIVCVKAYQVCDAIKSIIGTLSSQCHIVLLHNGMGPHLDVPAILHGQGLSLATTSQAALKHARWHIEQTGLGSTQFGHFKGEPLTQELSSVLLKAIPNSQWCEPILLSLWQKLAINAAINPLTAINHCKNGKLAEAQYRHLISAIVSELVEVALADGIELDKSALINRVYEVIELTAANFSSMHQDMINKRKTEIESINGYVVQRARHHQLSVKFNLSLLEQVKKMESDYLK